MTEAPVQPSLTHTFLGAYLQVVLVAANTVQIANARYAMAFVTGSLLSLVWTLNTHRAARIETWPGRFVYALGAGLGTVSGLWAGRHLL